MNTKSHLQWLGLTAVLFLLLAALVPASPAHADSCFVTTDADSGAGSLRERIADPVCETITFGGDYTIVLGSQLTIDRNVTIDGVGHTVTVSGNHAVRVFEVASGATFNLNNLTVANGNASTEAAYAGGGIYNLGTLVVTNGVFSGNSALTRGGGIYSEGDALTVTNSAFADNSAGTYSGGGGIYSQDGAMNVANSTFSGNSALYGGGIYAFGMLNVTDSTFTDNSVSTFGNGGGIYYLAASGDGGTVTNSTFSGNSALYGGGITNRYTLSVTNSTFTDNSAISGGGGGIFNNSDGTVTVTSSTFAENSATYYGGAIHNLGTTNVANSTFTGNSAGYDKGGGISNYRGTTNVANSTFSGNSAPNGGGIYSTAGMVTLTNSTFSGNTGSGISNSDSTATIRNTIVANSAGGGNCSNENSTLVGSNNLADDESCGPGFATSSSILLGPLADNGGPTQTMALLPGSAAIDTADDAGCPATDQRGVTRPQGAHCDIGAYEAESTNDNTAPTANPGGPYLGAINTAIAFDGSGSSDADGDALTYAWTFGDDGADTGATPTHIYLAAGVYDVCLTVNDGTADSPAACTMAVVYDPSAGFVTGGGWIDSPAGAYMPDPVLSGQATFGFVSKYKKGQNVPTGTTQFQFDVAGFGFYSDTYEWLVVNQGGTNAQFKGSGTVNGGLDPIGNPFKFMIWAGDDSPDTFRIKIWWEDGGTEVAVYDNGVDQPIGGGNVVVHTSK